MNEKFNPPRTIGRKESPWAIEPGSDIDQLDMARTALKELRASLRELAAGAGYTNEIEQTKNSFIVTPETKEMTAALLSHIKMVLTTAHATLKEAGSGYTIHCYPDMSGAVELRIERNKQ